VSDIDKERVFVSERTGRKYITLSLLDRKAPDEYGNDGYINEDITKEERESGLKPRIVGNWKFIVRPDAQKSAEPRPKFTKPAQAATDVDDSIPW
jgi:hypothetical protein